MNHLSVLNTEELSSVRKFQEYGSNLLVGFGNKATWADLVHTNAYSDDLIKTKLVALTTKINQQEALKDEDDDDFNDTEFYIKDGGNNSIPFTTKECQLFLRAARKCRKYFINAKELSEIDTQITKLQRSTLSKEDRVKNEIETLLAKKNKISGAKEVVVPTENVVSEVND